MKIVNKIKTQFKRFMTGKSGFSLVELIVVIAIMAVMAAVLAPALLGYVERSRAQKDDSAMGEVTNATRLSLADEYVYDELLICSVKDNYSCYADGDTATNIDANKTVTKSPDLWLYNDNARKLDEIAYKPSGKMRGITITLRPNGKSEYILKDGIVNKIGDDTTKKGSEGGKLLSEVQFSNVYNRLRSTIGDTVKVSSQTYRNSDYTIFISMGTTGGNQSDKQDAIKVYGQYNGTNLPEVAAPVNGGEQGGGQNPTTPDTPITEISHNDTIPSSGIYFDASKNKTLTEGEPFPVPGTNDWYTFEDFKYNWDSIGWKVSLIDGKSKTQESYSPLISQIAKKDVIRMNSTFQDCINLKSIPILPSGVRSLGSTFMGCVNLVSVPEIPTSVTSMVNTFNGCTALTTAPVIPNSVTVMQYTFKGCTSLTGTIIIDANPTNCKDCFANTVKSINLTGKSSKLSELAATAKGGNVTVK